MKKIWKKYKVTSIIMALCIFMFLIFGPVEVYYANFTDFDFTINDFLFYFISIAVACWLIGSIIISIFPEKINQLVNSIIFAVTVTAYIQNMFLNVKLMGTVGLAMDWANLKRYTVINTVIWILLLSGIFILLFYQKKYREKICIYVSTCLLLVQLVAFISLFIKLQSDEFQVNYYKLDAKNEFKVASDENVIIILLDATGENFFQEELKKDPHLVDGLEDFTYYTNYEPCYMTTCPAVTCLWTGSTPNCKISLPAWQKEAWNSENCIKFFERIHSNDFQCRFYTNHQRVMFADVKNMIGKVDNITNLQPQVNKGMMLAMLEKYTVYRYSPYIIKPRFEVNIDNFRGVVTYNEDNDNHEDMVDFYNVIKNNPISIDNNTEKAIIYHHFDGVHGPWNMDENGNKVEEYSVTQGQVIHGDMLAVREYLEQLKDLGVYDNSTIIISADHGDVFNKTDLQCIFFLKKKHEKHEKLQYNTAPISAKEFRASILYLIGDDTYSDFGKTYFEFAQDEIRERTSMVRDLGGKDGFYGYVYSGNGDDLQKTIEDGIDTEIPNEGGWCQ